MNIALADLSQLDILNGFFTLFANIFAVVIGLIIASKYFTYKKKELLTVGISLTFGGVPYWSSGIAFLTIIFFDYTPSLSFHLYFDLLVAVGLLFWIYSFSLLVQPEHIKRNMVIALVPCIIYDVVLFILILIDPTSLGRRTGPITGETFLFMTSFTLIVSVVLVVTFLIFINLSFKSKIPKLQWKARFLLIGIILSIIGSMVGIFFPDTPFVIIFTRTLRIITSISNYFGWLLPDRVARLLIKEEGLEMEQISN